MKSIYRKSVRKRERGRERKRKRERGIQDQSILKKRKRNTQRNKVKQTNIKRETGERERETGERERETGERERGGVEGSISEKMEDYLRCCNMKVTKFLFSLSKVIAN